MEIALYIVLGIIGWAIMGGITNYLLDRDPGGDREKKEKKEGEKEDDSEFELFLLALVIWPFILFFLLPAIYIREFLRKLFGMGKEEPGCVEDVKEKAVGNEEQKKEI